MRQCHCSDAAVGGGLPPPKSTRDKKVDRLERPLKFVMHGLAFHRESHGFFVGLAPDHRRVRHDWHHPKRMTTQPHIKNNATSGFSFSLS
jgi:hypothetical protein